MQNDKPLVSAIITTYKREAQIVERAIQSIEKQTYNNIEIIVVDDNPNSSEWSTAIMDMCECHATVKYIKQNGNKGACAARNLGISNSRGCFIGCLDDDDLWLPEKISKQIAVFLNDIEEKIGLVYCNGIKRVEETGKETPYNPRLSAVNEPGFIDELTSDYIGSTSHPLIRKKCFDKVGYFWEEQPARQDYEMWIRITKNYKTFGIDEPLFIHTMHDGDQISKNRERSYIGYKNIYKRYKQDYLRHPEAEKNILYYIVSNRKTLSFKVCLYGLRYYLLSLRICLTHRC